MELKGGAAAEAGVNGEINNNNYVPFSCLHRPVTVWWVDKHMRTCSGYEDRVLALLSLSLSCPNNMQVQRHHHRHMGNMKWWTGELDRMRICQIFTLVIIRPLDTSSTFAFGSFCSAFYAMPRQGCWCYESVYLTIHSRSWKLEESFYDNKIISSSTHLPLNSTAHRM